MSITILEENKMYNELQKGDRRGDQNPFINSLIPIAMQTDELDTYLNENYPENSREYFFIVVLFLNDYQRSRANLLLQMIEKSRMNELQMLSLCGSACYCAYDWIKRVDKNLHELTRTKETRQRLHDYFLLQHITEANDQFTDAILGEGYVNSIKQSVNRLSKALSNPT